MTSIPIEQLPGFRAFATEAFGFDPWLVELVPDPADTEPWAVWEEDGAPILPLHTTVGFALGVAWLAHKYDRGGCAVWLEFTDEPSEVALRYIVEGHARPGVLDVFHCPDISASCPTCKGGRTSDAWDPTAEPCPTCNGTGTNPHRAQQALAACLLSGTPNTDCKETT